MISRIKEELALLREHPQRLAYRELAAAHAEHLAALSILPDGDYGQLRPLLRFGGTPCLPRQDLVAMTGKAKCGKTFAMSILVAAALRGSETLGFEPGAEGLRVLYLDTEQAPYSTKHVLERIVCLSGRPYEADRLRVYNLRRESPRLRLELVVGAMAAMRPDLVVIDGVRDLLLDFNDIEESSTLVCRLMTLASDFDCSILCALHQNKPKDDNNMRGHLGSELENKAAEVYEMTRDEGLFCLRQTVARNEPLGRELRFEVRMGEGGVALPVEAGRQPEAGQPRQELDPRFRAILLNIMRDGRQMRYNEVIRAIWQQCKPLRLDGYAVWHAIRRGGYIIDAGRDCWTLNPQAFPAESRQGVLDLPTP